MASDFQDYDEEYNVGDSLDRGGKFLDGSHPGCYHMIISCVHRPAKNQDGMPIENALASVTCQVAAPKEHEGKMFDLTLWMPKRDSKDGGAFGQKKNDRFLAAVGAITPDMLKSKIRINWQGLAGRQFLVKLDSQEREIKSGKNRGQKKAFLDVSFAEFYHVDDPEAGTDYPRNAAAIKLLPASQRLTASTATSSKNVDDMDI